MHVVVNTTITAATFNALSDNADVEIDGTAALVVTYDEDGFVTAVYVSYNEPGEEEEVSTGALRTVVLADDTTDGQMTVTVTTTTNITGTVNLSVQEYMRATNTYVQVSTDTISFDNSNSETTTLTGLTSGTIYRVVATYGNGTMTSESAACIAN